MVNRIFKACAECGHAFFAQRLTAKYCSNRCLQKYAYWRKRGKRS